MAISVAELGFSMPVVGVMVRVFSAALRDVLSMLKERGTDSLFTILMISFVEWLMRRELKFTCERSRNTSGSWVIPTRRKGISI